MFNPYKLAHNAAISNIVNNKCNNKHRKPERKDGKVQPNHELTLEFTRSFLNHYLPIVIDRLTLLDNGNEFYISCNKKMLEIFNNNEYHPENLSPYMFCKIQETVEKCFRDDFGDEEYEREELLFRRKMNPGEDEFPCLSINQLQPRNPAGN